MTLHPEREIQAFYTRMSDMLSKKMLRECKAKAKRMLRDAESTRAKQEVVDRTAAAFGQTLESQDRRKKAYGMRSQTADGDARAGRLLVRGRPRFRGASRCGNGFPLAVSIWVTASSSASQIRRASGP
jgi:hypothetical protein